MKFGTGAPFPYFQCSRCECLQIQTVPPNLVAYYPEHFNSFCHDPEEKFSHRAYRFAANAVNRYSVFRTGTFGRLLARRFPNHNLASLSATGIAPDWRILDVGCGNGYDIYALKQIGFHHVEGLDPYLRKDIAYANGVRVRRAAIPDISGEWDIIMLHHSFEHVEAPLEALQVLARHLSPEGICLVRIPVVPCRAWEEYREHWVQIDAPRHLFIHSSASMELLAEKAGLRIDRIDHDSTGFQFWGSEQYRQGISLASDRSYVPGLPGRNRSIFTGSMIRRFEREARDLNRKGLGDQAAFHLKRKPGVQVQP